MGGRWRRWLGVSCISLCCIVCSAAQHQDAGFAGQSQLQQHGVHQLDADAPAQPPTVHLGVPSVHAPAAPRPAPIHRGSRKQQPTAAEPGSPRVPRPKVPLFSVIWMSGMMSLMSCLGVLPYFFVRQLSKPWAGLANAVASGVMLAASFGLLAEGGAYSGTYLITGMLLGVMFVKLSQTHLEKYEVDSFEQLAGADARKVILFLAVMAVHAVGEGGGVGVSFAGDRGWAQGTLVTLAIGLHNVPEGLAVATVMAARGTHPARTLLWTALTALPQALVAPPAFVFVDTFKALLPLALGFAAGCMIWIVLAELLPDALEAVEAEQVATYATASAAWLQGLSVFISYLETPSGTLASPFAAAEEMLPQGISSVLLHLLPACTVPGLVAVAAMHTRTGSRQPTAVCAAAGMLAGYSSIGGLDVLLWSEHKVFCGLLLPVVGVVLAAAMWVHWQNSLRPAASPNRVSSNISFDMTPRSLKKDTWQSSAADVAISPAAVHPAVGSHHRSSCGHGLTVQDGSCHDQQQQQQQCHLSASPYMPTIAAIGWDASSTSSSGSNSNWPCQQQVDGPGVRSIWCNNSPVKGEYHTPNTAGHNTGRMPLSSKHGVHCVEANCSNSSWLSQDLPDCRALGGRIHPDHNSRIRSAGCVLTLVGAAICGVPVGLQLASALAAAPDAINHLALPLAMLGVPFGLVYSGLLSQLIQDKPALVSATAAALGTLPLTVAVIVLLAQPYWVQQGMAFALADILQGVLTGFNVVAPLLLVAAVHRRWGWSKCSVGSAAGVSGGLLVGLCLTLMCWGTPYCLRWAGPALISKTA